MTVVKPAHLRERLESDLLKDDTLKKDFDAFIQHALRVSEAFRLVDNSPPTQREEQSKKKKSKQRSRSGARNSQYYLKNKDTADAPAPGILCPSLVLFSSFLR